MRMKLMALAVMERSAAVHEHFQIWEEGDIVSRKWHLEIKNTINLVAQLFRYRRPWFDIFGTGWTQMSLPIVDFVGVSWLRCEYFLLNNIVLG
jgi:hypothetical protein